jgi:Tol biopolymer transport system component
VRALAGAVAIGAVLRLPLGEPASLVTVAQADAQHIPLGAASAFVSADGRYVAFTSYVPLAPADTNNQRDVYVLDRTTGRVTLESGGRARDLSGDVEHPAISADGRWLVYSVMNVVFLRDVHHSTTRVVAEGHDPIVSNDGRFVAFTSSHTQLVDGIDANGASEDVYQLAVDSGRIERVSVDSSGLQPAKGWSVAPSVSDDGRFVAFASTAPLSPTGRSNAQKPESRVYVRDTVSQTTKLVATGWKPALSGNGRYVAFVSAADHLVSRDRNKASDIFVADLATGAIDLVSRSASGGSGNGASANPSLSSDGRFVVFQSDASDLVCRGECSAADEDINLLWDVFVVDRQSKVTTRLSADPSAGWMEPSTGPAIDGAGTVVAFSSRHAMDITDKANDYDLFIRQLTR